MPTGAGQQIEPFPWSKLRELADCVGVDVALAEELLEPEISEWVKSLGLDRPDTSKFEELLSERLQDKVDQEGLRSSEAALYLGMTEDSFRRLLELQLLSLHIRTGIDGEHRFLKAELDRFCDHYLPSFKTWTTRTSLLLEFFQNLESREGLRVEPQFCEIAPCEHLAAVVCANPNCRENAAPRKVCVAHREHLRDNAGRSLCAFCVRRVLYGDLGGTYEIAGSRDRLLRVYPNA